MVKNMNSIRLRSGEYEGRKMYLIPLCFTLLTYLCKRIIGLHIKNQLQNAWILMDRAVVQDDNRIWSGVRLHMFKQTLDELTKQTGRERPENDVAVQDPIQ
jgi:hypothetical protein